ncbi:hypothetical protein GCM10010289_59500 [Streptomyces violascens]|nr:hypothetical protein GCM10010289_59500 [Streptomyces violascens]
MRMPWPTSTAPSKIDPTYTWAYINRGSTYRSMNRYDDALADFNRAIGLRSGDAWNHFEVAVTLRLLGRPLEHDHWREAVHILTAEASAGGSDAVHASGNLLVIYCALPEWDKAAEEVERFLTYAPTPSRIREALEDLAQLPETLPVDLPLLQSLQRRLESTTPGL